MRTRTVVVAALLALGGCKKKASAPERKSTAADAAATTKAPPAADAAPTARPAAEVAVAFVEHVARGEADAAIAMFDASGKVTPDQVTGLWKEVAGDGGALRAASAVADPADPGIQFVTATLEHGLVEARIAVQGDKVRGLSLKPLYATPDYVSPASFEERPVAVGSGPTALRGVLSVPTTGPGPFPAVLLVHGSGGSDLDEWAPEANVMPFRDLAGGLASRGVAVLRFDKATWGPRAIARKMDAMTVTEKEEYLDPVGEALAALEARPEIDRKRVYVLGHSMGGWLLPWILRDHPEVAGGIVASGNARNLADVIVEQDQYLAKLNYPTITADQLAQLRAIDEAKAAKAHDPNLADDTPLVQLPLGVNARAWKMMQGYDAPAVAGTLGRPFLLLQGGRDYNVTMVDQELWQKGLAGQDVTAKAYPDLNHVYVTGTGTATPAELKQGGHVAAIVVDDIAAWVKAR